jgi:hypothetical protein
VNIPRLALAISVASGGALLALADQLDAVPPPVARFQPFADADRVPKEFQDRLGDIDETPTDPPVSDLRGVIDQNPEFVWWGGGFTFYRDDEPVRVVPAPESPRPSSVPRPDTRKRVLVRITPASRPLAPQAHTRPRSAGLLCTIAPKLCD